MNKIIPKEALITISSGNGFCHQKQYKFNIESNDANYTMSLEYDTKSNYINITTFSNIESYHYKFQVEELIGNLESRSIDPNGINENIRVITCTNITTKVNSETILEVPSKNEKESIIIFNN